MSEAKIQVPPLWLMSCCLSATFLMFRSSFCIPPKFRGIFGLGYSKERSQPQNLDPGFRICTSFPSTPNTHKKGFLLQCFRLAQWQSVLLCLFTPNSLKNPTDAIWSILGRLMKTFSSYSSRESDHNLLKAWAAYSKRTHLEQTVVSTEKMLRKGFFPPFSKCSG